QSPAAQQSVTAQDRNGKSVVRNVAHNKIAQADQDTPSLQQMFALLQEENAKMKEAMQAMAEELQAVKQTAVEREGAYMALQALLEQQPAQHQQAGLENNNNIEGLNYGSMTSSAVADYGGVSELGSQNSATYRDTEADTIGDTTSDNDV
ncbi:hypothetical protein BGW39_002564, partial [Mortierella sp. 14UC]